MYVIMGGGVYQPPSTKIVHFRACGFELWFKSASFENVRFITFFVYIAHIRGTVQNKHVR